MKNSFIRGLGSAEILRPQAGVGQAEGDDPLLQVRADAPGRLSASRPQRSTWRFQR